jgi:hypothetical protein
MEGSRTRGPVEDLGEVDLQAEATVDHVKIVAGWS